MGSSLAESVAATMIFDSVEDRCRRRTTRSSTGRPPMSIRTFPGSRVLPIRAWTIAMTFMALFLFKQEHGIHILAIDVRQALFHQKLQIREPPQIFPRVIHLPKQGTVPAVVNFGSLRRVVLRSKNEPPRAAVDFS